HTRGALNVLGGVELASGARRARAPRRARRRSLAMAAQTLFLVAVVVGATHLAASVPPAVAEGVNGGKQLAAEGDAFVARVEYDIPLPAGIGSVARVAGRVGPPSGENSYGLAASPSHLDAVVGLLWANPISDEDPLKPGDQSKGPVPIPDE